MVSPASATAGLDIKFCRFRLNSAKCLLMNQIGLALKIIIKMYFIDLTEAYGAIMDHFD